MKIVLQEASTCYKELHKKNTSPNQKIQAFPKAQIWGSPSKQAKIKGGNGLFVLHHFG